MSRFIARRRVLVAIIFVLVAVVATESVVLAAITVRQGSVEYMKVATTTDVAITYSTTWADVPGTALAMSIPSGEHDFFQIAFAINAPGCARKTATALYALCYVRALVDGQEAAPGPVTFGIAGVSSPRLPATMHWVSGVLAPGTHYIKLQFMVNASNNYMVLRERTMTVVRARAY